MSVRCTPFCGPCDKGYKHHELLVALLNTNDIDQQGFYSDEEEHHELKQAIKKYKAKGWDINTEIDESNLEFRFPLLHWACVLGKIRTVRWLLNNGFSPTVQTKDTLETCLHRALLTLPELSSTKSGRLSMLRFETILPYLRSCLAMGNHRQNTPLHIAAQFMIQNKCYTLYENLLLSMVTEIQKMNTTQRLQCLNAQNASGDTVLNLLASGCKSVTVIEKLLDVGADCMLVNKLNIGPIDSAQRNGLIHIENFLKTSLLSGVHPVETEYHDSIANDDLRKRRSERKATYYNTMASLNNAYNASGKLTPESKKQRPCTPKKDSEKGDKSTDLASEQTVPVPTGEMEVAQDELDESSLFEASSQSSHSVEDNLPLAMLVCGTNASISTTEQVSPQAVKDDDSDEHEMCQCCGDDKDDITPNTASLKNQNETDFLNAMKEAGVLPNLSGVISKTKAEHLSRLNAINKSISEVNGKTVKQVEKEKSIEKDIEKKKREIVKLSNELYTLRKEKVEANNKRKLLEEERREVRKKLAGCEKLLKTVPKDTSS